LAETPCNLEEILQMFRTNPLPPSSEPSVIIITEDNKFHLHYVVRNRSKSP